MYSGAFADIFFLIFSAILFSRLLAEDGFCGEHDGVEPQLYNILIFITSFPFPFIQLILKLLRITNLLSTDAEI
uniref:Ion transport domain-containing protein n=1 Tax=Ascaris lumbricoides TaxID=6252 RepID=A0A0M3INK6_ASCLU